jgi:DNA-binding transcriptional MocR family regulator
MLQNKLTIVLSHNNSRTDGAVEIARAIEAAVDAGELAGGTRLPTVRDLARERSVSPTTVAAAYRMLRERGLLVGRGRAGTFVRASEALLPKTTAPIPAGVRDLRTGNPDRALLPDLGPALASIDARSALYDDPLEEPDLLKLAAREFRKDGIPAEAMAVSCGALDGIERILAAHLRPGDRVLVEDPGFPNIFDLIAALGLTAVGVAIDEKGLREDALEEALSRGARALVVTPRAQNPTGAALDADRARALRKLLQAAPDLLVIEDDHAAGVAGAKAQTLVDPGRRHWAVVRSVSKSLGPDLRVAVVTGDEETIRRLRTRQRTGMRWVSRLLQKIVVALWSSREVRRGLSEAEKTYARRRRALIDALAARGIAAQGTSGMNVWIPVAEEAAAMAALQGRGWAVAAGERYRIVSSPALRVTVATLEPEEAEALARDIAEILAPDGMSGA